MRVRFVSAATAIAYIPQHDRIARTTISIDSDGRRWIQKDLEPEVLMASPDRPAKRTSRKRGTTR